MIDSKTINDLYTDWCIKEIAKKQGIMFNKYYFQYSRKILDCFNKHLGSTTNIGVQSSYRYNQVKQSVDTIRYNSLIDKVYLKGGSVADYYGLNPIKPSDIDCSLVLSRSNHNNINASNMETIGIEINKQLDLFYHLIPTEYEHKEFFDLLRATSGSKKINVYNSYSGRTIVDDKNIKGLVPGNVPGNSKMEYSVTYLGDIVIIRYFWRTEVKCQNNDNLLVRNGNKIVSQDFKSLFKMKINIVDLSVHLYEPNQSTLSLPEIVEQNIEGTNVWVPSFLSMLNDQLITFASGLIKNDRKLMKRINRSEAMIKIMVNNLIINNPTFITDKPASVDLKSLILSELLDSNYEQLILKILVSEPMYLFTVLPFILKVKGDDVIKYIKATGRLDYTSYLVPQTAVLDHMYKGIDEDKRDELIAKGIDERIQEYSELIRGWIKVLNNMPDYLPNKLDLVTMKKYNILYAGRINLPSEEDVAQFLKELSEDELNTALSLKLINGAQHFRYTQFKNLEITTILLILDDDDYNVYNNLKQLNTPEAPDLD